MTIVRRFEIVSNGETPATKITIAVDRVFVRIPDLATPEQRQRIISFAVKVAEREKGTPTLRCRRRMDRLDGKWNFRVGHKGPVTASYSFDEFD